MSTLPWILRVRGNDVLFLAQHFVELVSKQTRKPVGGFSAPVAAKLTSYRWPGNVRELQNCIERAVILADGDTIHIGSVLITFHARPPQGSTETQRQ